MLRESAFTPSLVRGPLAVVATDRRRRATITLARLHPSRRAAHRVDASIIVVIGSPCAGPGSKSSPFPPRPTHPVPPTERRATNDDAPPCSRRRLAPRARSSSPRSPSPGPPPSPRRRRHLSMRATSPSPPIASAWRRRTSCPCTPSITARIAPACARWAATARTRTRDARPDTSCGDAWRSGFETARARWGYIRQGWTARVRATDRAETVSDRAARAHGRRWTTTVRGGREDVSRGGGALGVECGLKRV